MLFPQRKLKAKKYPVEMQKTPTGKRPWTALRPPKTEGGEDWHALRKPKQPTNKDGSKKEFWR